MKETKVAAVAAKHQNIADQLFKNVINAVHGLRAFRVKRHADTLVISIGGRLLRCVYRLRGSAGSLCGELQVIESNRLLRQVFWNDEGTLTNGAFGRPLAETVTSKGYAAALIVQACNTLFDLREPILTRQ
ncbi:hypothetical protein LF1_48650 [Rubripirellula obstinata]|uniref:Uncharacterized protein n=1 Tax=Rubripirellula obstinata TaxID=406547 RepID=A0A5B1CPZ0_9BACT|nr:hypothetical protein [Rubripirellula obstinata]KAA1262301.1 hypothetical protein LF1_48650 [Rubripirellula obstinata]